MQVLAHIIISNLLKQKVSYLNFNIKMEVKHKKHLNQIKYKNKNLRQKCQPNKQKNRSIIKLIRL
jgi:hypothetical protein